MWTTALLSFFAGFLGASSVPHFVKGITKEQFPTTFGVLPLGQRARRLDRALRDRRPHRLGGYSRAPRHGPDRTIALGTLPISVVHATLGAFRRGEVTRRA